MTYRVFKVGQIWHYRYQVAGARVQKSTRQRVRRLAEPIAQQSYAEALTRSNGGTTVPTLAALIASWRAVHAPVISADHARSVEACERLHLYALGAMAIDAITTEHIELARNQHLLTHKPASANHWLRILKLTVNWAVKRDIIAAIPWKVKMLKVQKRPRSILPIESAKEWFDAVDASCAPAVGTAIRMMFGLGLRESESASARWEWIDWQRATYTPGITKGREAEPVPVPDWLADHLMAIRQPSGLIASRPNGKPHPPGFARKAMTAANAACEIKGITPHRLRGTFATLLSEAGVPIQTIQKVMRHKSPMTTMAYLEKNLDTAALAQNTIAGKIGFGTHDEKQAQTA